MEEVQIKHSFLQEGFNPTNIPDFYIYIAPAFKPGIHDPQKNQRLQPNALGYRSLSFVRRRNEKIKATARDCPYRR